MASGSDNPEKEASKWFVLTILGCILYIAAAFTFVVSQDVEPTEDQIQESIDD